MSGSTSYTPTPGPGVMGQVLFRLGWIPSSELGQINTQIGALQAQVAAAQAEITTLKAQQSSLGAQVASLTAKYNGLQNTISTLQAQLKSLQSTITSLNSKYSTLQSTETSLESTVANLKNELAGLNADLASLQSQWTALKATLAKDASTISSLTSSLSTLKSEVQAYNTIAAKPTYSATLNEPEAGKVDGFGPDDASSNGYLGWAPLQVGLASGFVGLATGGTSAHAVPALQTSSSGYRPGQYLAGALGYVPISAATNPGDTITALETQLANLNAQIAALNTQISVAQGAITKLQGEISSDQSTVTSLNGEITTAQSTISTLQGEIAKIQSTISGLETQATDLAQSITTAQGEISTLQTDISNGTKQHQSNLTQIAALQTQETQWGVWLRDIENGDYPVTFSWTFGDGGTGTADSPTHTYKAGTFQPTIKITVVRPDGVTVTKTFTPGKFIVGMWPTSLKAPWAQSGGNAVVTPDVYDTYGNLIDNTLVEAHLQVWVVWVMVDKGRTALRTPGTFVANGVEPTSPDLGNGWKVTLRSIRNPTLTATASDGYTG